MKFQTCDYAAFLGYIAYAGCALAIPVVLPKMLETHSFLAGSGAGGAAGSLHLWRSAAMLCTMLLCTFIAGRWGKRAPLGVALTMMGVGIMAVSLANSYWLLVAVLVFSGLGQGVFEVLITPCVQDTHRDSEPARYINITHGFWSAGTVGVLLGGGFALQYGVSWRLIPLFIGLFALVPGIFFLILSSGGRHRTEAERRPPRLILRQMRNVLLEPRFFFFLGGMLAAGGIEHSLLFWMPTYILVKYQAGAAMSGTGAAVFACGMLLGRWGAGILLPQRSIGYGVIGCAMGALVTGMLAPFAANVVLFFTVLFLIGLFVGPLWPGIQSHCLNRIKWLDQTTMLILLPCVGIPGCGFFAWLMGKLSDAYGFQFSFLVVPFCAFLLILLNVTELLTRERVKKLRTGQAEGEQSWHPLQP